MSDTTEAEVVAPEAGTTEEPTFEQYPEDHPLVTALARQKDKLAAERARTEALAEKARRFDELEEANKTELQKAQERAEAAERALEQTRLEAIRSEVALAKGLTTSQAKRLVGDSREALEADADELLADLKATAPSVAPSSDAQGKQGEPVGQAKQIASRADLQGMTAEEINAARREGRLNSLLTY
jgi:hypothetical protein